MAIFAHPLEKVKIGQESPLAEIPALEEQWGKGGVSAIARQAGAEVFSQVREECAPPNPDDGAYFTGGLFRVFV